MDHLKIYIDVATRILCARLNSDSASPSSKMINESVNVAFTIVDKVSAEYEETFGPKN